MRPKTSQNAGNEARIENLARYGITRIPVDNFYYRGFHYTNLADAVAQAMRDEAQTGPLPDQE